MIPSLPIGVAIASTMLGLVKLPSPPSRPKASPTLVGPILGLVMSFTPHIFDPSDEEFPGDGHRVERIRGLVRTRCNRLIPIGKVRLEPSDTPLSCPICKAMEAP